MSSSPFAGFWRLYGRENADVLLDSLSLPDQYKCVMKNVRTCEEIHVNGDNVHVNIHVPGYTIPAHSKEFNFAFDVESSQCLPFGKEGKGVVHKQSDTKWVAKLTHEQGSCSIVREIRNGEMWVTIEGCHGVKMVRKFERCAESHSDASPAGPKDASPFQGCWRLYGSENYDKFMEAAGVPAHWRFAFADICVKESIHVNGSDVHLKIVCPDLHVHPTVHEFSFKFGDQREINLPFGYRAVARAHKVSDTKWEAILSGLEKLGDAKLFREIVGDEMWLTIEAKDKRIVQKYVRSRPCCSAGSCDPDCQCSCPKCLAQCKKVKAH